MTTPKPRGWLRPSPLPVNRDLRSDYVSSLAIALGVATVSTIGLVWGGLYPAQSATVLVARAGDAANLIVVLPSLLAALWLTRRGSLLGLLLWPGVLFYALYIYAIYLIGAPFSGLVFAYVALVVLSAATLVRVVASIDGERVRQCLTGTPARAVGGALLVLGVVAYGGLIATGVSMLAGPATELGFRPHWVVDCAIGTPALLFGGALLWRRATVGYVVAAGLLLVSGLGGLAYAIAGALDGALTAQPTEPTVIAVHLVIGAVSLALLGFFIGRADDG